MNRFQLPARRTLPAQEIYFTPPQPATSNVGMTLVCAGLLLTTVSACFLPVVSRAATSAAPEIAAPAATTAPDAHRRVFQQGLPTYHWHHNCPVVGSPSQRASNDATKKRIYMTQTEAKQESLTACSFCLDME